MNITIKARTPYASKTWSQEVHDMVVKNKTKNIYKDLNITAVWSILIYIIYSPKDTIWSSFMKEWIHNEREV